MSDRRDKITVGAKAPKLTLPDGMKNNVDLSNFSGKWVVLYFYPKDNTPGCTTEALDFTALKNDFDALNAVIIGVSPDSSESHCKFAEKHNLSIILLSDGEKKTIEKFGAWKEKKQYGKKYFGVARTTVLIDPSGKVAYIWENVRAEGHAREVMDHLKNLQLSQASRG